MTGITEQTDHVCNSWMMSDSNHSGYHCGPYRTRQYCDQPLQKTTCPTLVYTNYSNFTL